MSPSRTFAFRLKAARPATFGLAVVFALAGAGSTFAGQGGNPVDQRTISGIVAGERAKQSAAQTVLPAVAPSEPGWHDKSEEQWRDYHRYDREWKERNAGR